VLVVHLDMTDKPQLSRNSLVGTVQLFSLMMFYLLPAIFLYQYIGPWSMLVAAAFWGILATAAYQVRKRVNRASDS
jgi:hypothetical protein